MDCYSALEVPPTASTETIRSAYRRLAQKWHPDKHEASGAEATHRMSEINLAWEILKDPETRRINDEARLHRPDQTPFSESSQEKPRTHRPHAGAPMMMEVDSGCVGSIGHDGLNKLFVEFRSGGLYVYFGVPVATFAALVAAKSKGRFLIFNIVNGPYRCKRIGA